MAFKAAKGLYKRPCYHNLRWSFGLLHKAVTSSLSLAMVFLRTTLTSPIIWLNVHDFAPALDMACHMGCPEAVHKVSSPVCGQ